MCWTDGSKEGEDGRRRGRPRRTLRSLLWSVLDRLDGFDERLDSIGHQLAKIKEKVMTQQDTLNAFVTRIDTAVVGIRQDIADLKAAVEAGQPLDFTALEERVSGLEGLDAENPVPTPEPEPPVE